MSRNPSHYCGGIVTEQQLYELRLNGKVVETSANNVDLYWKARRAVNGIPDAHAEVEAIKGFYACARFSDATLLDWERGASEGLS